MTDPPFRRSEKAEKIFLLVLTVLLCLVKHSLAVSLPVEARDYRTDDLLMVSMAEGLLQGNWLGAYGPVTLMKGAFFPLFLAAAGRIGPSYLSVLDILNTLSVLFFVSQLRRLILNRRLLFVLSAVLLFEPCFYSQATFQRVYRSSLTEMQVLFLFGSYFGLFLAAGSPSGVRFRLETAANFLRAGIAGLALWSMWNTREESAWIIPFVLAATLLAGFRLFRVLPVRMGKASGTAAALLCCLLPFLILLSGNALIRSENSRYYGAPVRLEDADGEFAGALKTIYSVRNRNEIPYATVSREKLERLYAVSASLRRIRPELETQLEFYQAADRHANDSEVEDGWFCWGLKRAAFDNGIADTLPSSEAYWKQVRLEIEAALDDPESGLERQHVMPSALISPWRPEYLASLPRAIGKAVRYMVSYQDLSPLTKASGKAGASCSQRFESITNNPVIYPDGTSRIRKDMLETSAGVLNRIISVYRAVNPAAALLSAAAYLLFAGYCVMKKSVRHVPFLLIVLGMALSAAVMVSGSAYTEISAFPAIRYFYLSGAYGLMIACEWVTILYLFGCLADMLRGMRFRSGSGSPSVREKS